MGTKGLSPFLPYFPYDVGVDEFDAYAFDVQGYVVCRQVLTAEEVEAAREAFTRALQAAPGSARHQKPTGELRLENLLGWGPDVLRLLDHPVVVDILASVVDPSFRLDHSYALWHPTGTGGIRLHGGGPQPDGAAFYSCVNGRIRSGLTAVGWALLDAPPGGGGFLVIPGSHKANFALPEGGDARAMRELAVPVPLNAGDCVVFSESLTHAAAPWTGDEARMALFFKYAPGWAAWGGRPSAMLRYPHTAWSVPEGASKRQRLLLEPPYAHARAPVV